MDFKNFLILISALINISLGVFVVLKDQKKTSNRSYFVMTLGIFFWSMAMIFYRVSGDVSNSIWWCKMLYTAPIIIVGAFVYFTSAFPDNIVNKKTKIIAWLLCLVELYFTLFSDKVISSVLFRAGQEKIIYFGQYYYFYVLFVSGFFVWGYFILLQKILRGKGTIKTQLQYIFWGTFLASSLAMITNLLLPTFGIFYFNWAGQMLSIIMMGFIAYAIVRYRLMGIRLIFSNAIIVWIFSLYFFLSYYFVSWLNQEVFVSRYLIGDWRWLVNLGLALVFALLFLPLLKFSREFSEKIVYQKFNPQRLTKDFIIKLSKKNDLESLSMETIGILKQALDLEQVGVIVFDEAGQASIPVSSDWHFDQIPELQSVLKKSKQIIIRDEVCLDQRPQWCEELFQQKINAILPISHHSAIILGEKNTAKALDSEEINFLETLQPHLGDYFFRVVNLKKIEQRNQELEDLQQEFLSIVGNQLHTPIYIMKGLLKIAKSDPIEAERKEELLESVFNRINKLGEATSNALLATKLATGMREIEFKPVNVVRVLKEAVVEKESLAKEKSLLFKLKILSEGDIYINSCISCLEQIFANILDNAILYTPVGTVVVNLKKEGDCVKISISDTGVGIADEDRPRIFSKFFKGKNNYNREGLGLGLFIVKKLVDLHVGANITIESAGSRNGTKVILTFLMVEKVNFD